MLVDPSKYNIKCPYSMNPTRIVVHNTYNDASANNEISYMINNNYQTSFHFAVDDKEAVQGLPLDRNGWHAGDGNGKGNREGIGIEICYSLSGGERFNQAERNACKLIAGLLKERGWGIDKVTKHQDYANKYCPHRTLDMGWERFLNMIREELGQAPAPTPTHNITGDITYKVYDNAKRCYLPSVVNDRDYAGNRGNTIGGIKAKCVNGNIYIQSHIIGKSKNDWEEPVILNAGNYDSSSSNAYSGILGKNIDCVKIWSDYGYVLYRVSPVNSNYYAWVDSRNRDNGSSESYAGSYGKAIDRLQMR